MTVNYSSHIATIKYGSFARLLLRWRGSVYKLIWPGLLAFCLCYTIVAIIYQCIPLTTPEYCNIRRHFVQFCAYASRLSNAIPISFVLGFYVNLVVGRWWKQFLNLPTPDSVCFLLATYLKEPPKQRNRELSKLDLQRPLIFRRTISRYLNLSSVLCLSSISFSMKRRFPTYDSLVMAGLMTEQELDIYSELDDVTNCFYIPLVWAITLISKAHHENMLIQERHLDALVREVASFWQRLYNLFLYDWVNIPLVYHQVVTLAVCVYFAISVLSRQFLDPDAMLKSFDQKFNEFNNSSLINTTISQLNQTLSPSASALNVFPHIPLFTILTIVFYLGWLKVAESHVFPFGLDDDDFEVVPLIERNLNTSISFVDTLINQQSNLLPLLVRTGCRPELESLPISSNQLDGDHKNEFDNMNKMENKSKLSVDNYLNPSNLITHHMEQKNRSIFDSGTGHHDNTNEVDENYYLSKNSINFENEVPKLPNINSKVNHKLSQSGICGSMALIYGDENQQKFDYLNNPDYVNSLNQLYEQNSENLSHSPRIINSLGTFFDNFSRRLSRLSLRHPSSSISGIENHPLNEFHSYRQQPQNDTNNDASTSRSNKSELLVSHFNNNDTPV